jgi:ankyrin repeat protein
MNYKQIAKIVSLAVLATAFGQSAQAMKMPKAKLNAMLLYAAEQGNSAIVIKLLDQGANINCKDNNGNTPLMHASMYNYLAIAQLLLERGADSNCTNDCESTPLIYAAMRNHLEMAQLLSEHNADIYYKGYNGKTALDFAHQYGYVEIAKLLINEPYRRQSRQQALLLIQRLLTLRSSSSVLANAPQQAKNNPALAQTIQEQQTFSYPSDNNLALIAPICSLNRE